jgi:hypothetical protein
MSMPDLARRRLSSQRISQSQLKRPNEAVAWLGAIQAQDYASALWAVGLRCVRPTQASIEQAITDRSILRTWLLRGTLHFVAAQDVRWILALVAPRLIAQSARRNRELDLDPAAFDHGMEILLQALQGGRQATRQALMQAFEQGNLSPQGQRGYHLLRRAALEGLICFGPMQGEQPTFVLLDEWALQRRLEGEQALAELARRYFSGHGPATERDFIGWSGLAAGQARLGLELVKAELQSIHHAGQTLWHRKDDLVPADQSPGAYLLPAFDEYYLGYADRSIILDTRYERRAVSSNGVFRPMIVLDGQVAGIWQRELKKDTVVIRLEPFDALKDSDTQELAAAALRYGAFLGRSLDIQVAI